MRLLRMLVISSGLICMVCGSAFLRRASGDALSQLLEPVAARWRPAPCCRPGARGRRARRGRPCSTARCAGPVCSSIRLPMPSTSSGSSLTALVTVTGSSLFSSRHSRSNARRMRKIAGIRWRSASSSRKRTKFSSASSISLADALLLLLRGEVGREEEDLQVAVLVQRVGELAELLVHAVEVALLLGDLEQRARVDLGDLLHLARCRPCFVAGQRGEVDLGQRLFDQAAVVLVVERLARDLLGGDARSGRRPPCGSRRAPAASPASMSLARGLHQLLAVLLGVGLRLAPGGASAALRERATMSSACSRASFSRARYSSSSWSASSLVRIGGVDRLVDRLAALVERLGDAREGELAQH